MLSVIQNVQITRSVVSNSKNRMQHVNRTPHLNNNRMIWKTPCGRMMWDNHILWEITWLCTPSDHAWQWHCRIATLFAMRVISRHPRKGCYRDSFLITLQTSFKWFSQSFRLKLSRKCELLPQGYCISSRFRVNMNWLFDWFLGYFLLQRSSTRFKLLFYLFLFPSSRSNETSFLEGLNLGEVALFQLYFREALFQLPNAQFYSSQQPIPVWDP